MDSPLNDDLISPTISRLAAAYDQEVQTAQEAWLPGPFVFSTHFPVAAGWPQLSDAGPAVPEQGGGMRWYRDQMSIS